MSKKLALVISSFSGMLESEVNQEKDIFLTPLQLFIKDKEWFEGFYSIKEKYEIVEMFKSTDDFKTSLGPIGMIEQQMESLSAEYDDVIYLPINSYLSSSHDTILNISKKYENVHVIDTKLVGLSFLYCAREAKRRYEQLNHSIDDVINFLKWYIDRTIGFIVPYELKTFIKSGRLKGIKKTIMTSLNLKTIVEFNYVLKSGGIAKSVNNASAKIMDKIDSFIKEYHMKIDDFLVTTIYAYDEGITNTLKESMKKYFNKNVDESYEASLSTTFHTGWGAGYIGINPRIDKCPLKITNTNNKQ